MINSAITITSMSALKAYWQGWLYNYCLPLWEQSLDPRGGFFERIHQDGSPDNIDRRSRVAARQIYSYALAKDRGYKGQADLIIQHGLNWLNGPCQRGDGYIYATLDPDGAVVRAQFDFYDHVFLLLGLASAYRVTHNEKVKTNAYALMAALEKDYAHPLAGFEESAPPTLPLKANPHMHLLEASLAWYEASHDKVWLDRAKAMANLCLERFLDPVTGALREFFNAQWGRLNNELDQHLEPGHQFEWAWLLIRLYEICSHEAYLEAAKKLIFIGEAFGTDVNRNVSINIISDTFTPKDNRARLWPQTERIKAYCALYRNMPDAQKSATEMALLSACQGLMPYLGTRIQGLWYDQMDENGLLIEESAPTSSLYHITCAIDEVLSLKTNQNP